MSEPSLVRGPVTFGFPRISVLALLDESAARWSAAEWEQLRESGVSAVCLDANASTSVPLFRAAELSRDGNAAGVLFLDEQCRIASYPAWSREQGRPWGPRLEGPDALPLALAAVTAGASLVALPCPEPTALSALVAVLRDLASVLGRELTRVPKPAEGTTRSAAVSRYSALGAQKVAFQGEHGAFSEMAVFNLFSPHSQAVPCTTFRDVFSAVFAGDVDYGMIPIENALAGPINENYDLLLEFADLHIVGETQVRVEHNLIGVPGTKLADIRQVLSHPMGLAQSKLFLDGHPEWAAVPFYDTAGSVKHVAATGDRSLAAIASAEAARVYGMEILVPGVETNHRNFTRFFLISPRSREGVGSPNKASLVFATADQPGALSRCLAVFATHGVNMTKLESRPIHGRPWDYMFYVDARLPEQPQGLARALDDLGHVAKELRVLGVYES